LRALLAYENSRPWDPSGLRFEGGGGKDEYATSAGGRLSYDMSMGKNATLSPYVEGFLAKPKDRKLTGRATGAGVVYNKRFKSGGATTKSKVNRGRQLHQAGDARVAVQEHQVSGSAGYGRWAVVGPKGAANGEAI
jgi:hypothetical protein